jgi:hypothetical protein
LKDYLKNSYSYYKTTTLLNLIAILLFMTQSTRLDNSTYNILIVLGKEADFLYSTVDTYIEDAKKDNRQHLVDIWNQMKRDKERHLQMLREALEKEAKDEKLSK